MTRMNGVEQHVGPGFRRATASAPGSCGELAQGLLEGTQVLVTCPIDRYATATVDLAEGRGRVHGPVDSPKACRAAELALARSGQTDVDVYLHLESPLPRGKGMASSTADVLASMGAAASALGMRLLPRDYAHLALQVEPSDGLMFPGIALFDHRRGTLCRPLGQPPAMQVLALDFGGTVDTVAFNATDWRQDLAGLELQFQKALDLIAEGLSTRDGYRIGRGATLSARAYQRIDAKPQLDAALALARVAGAAGVNVAHSGTILGVLFPDDDERVAWAAREARARLAGLCAAYRHRVRGGGVALEAQA